jgi:hypothetical protein
MATTTNYGWTTPDDTALVKDGAAAIRTLGSSVDTTTKNLNPSTTLGDIEYRSSTANTNTRLGIGSTGQVLTVSGGVPSWATASSGGMTLISTTTLTGASITLSSIPATYKHLQLIIQNFKPATDDVALYMQFNGVTTNSYNGQLFTTTGPSAFDRNYISIIQNVDNTADNGLSCVNVWNYTNTVTWKMATFFSFANNATTSTSISSRNGSGWHNNTAAISSITLFPESGNFTSGTVLLYGVS